MFNLQCAKIAQKYFMSECNYRQLFNDNYKLSMNLRLKDYYSSILMSSQSQKVSDSSSVVEYSATPSY